MSEEIKKEKEIQKEQDKEQGYEPTQFDPDTVSVGTYLFDLNNQLFELNKNVKIVATLLADLVEHNGKSDNFLERKMRVTGILGKTD